MFMLRGTACELCLGRKQASQEENKWLRTELSKKGTPASSHLGLAPR